MAGKRHGLGTYFFSDGSKYAGEWVEGQKHGDFVFTDENGKTWDEQWA